MTTNVKVAIAILIPVVSAFIFNTEFVNPYRINQDRAKIFVFGQCFFDASFAACR
jgi:hypothetical protein